MESLHKQIFVITSTMAMGASLILSAFQSGYWEVPMDLALIFMAYYIVYYHLKKSVGEGNPYRRSMSLIWSIIFALYLTMHMINYESGFEYLLTVAVINITFYGMAKSNWFLIDTIVDHKKHGRFLKLEKTADGFLIALVLLITPFAINLHSVDRALSPDWNNTITLLAYFVCLTYGFVLLVNGIIKRTNMTRNIVLILNIVSLVVLMSDSSVMLNTFAGRMIQWFSIVIFYIWLLDQFPTIEHDYYKTEWDKIFRVFEEREEGVLLVSVQENKIFKLERMNNAVERLLGYGYDSMVNCFNDIFDPRLMKFRSWQTIEPMIYEQMSLKRANGELIPVNLIVQPYPVGSEIVYLMQIFDLSHQLENEKKLTIYEKKLYELAYLNPVTRLKNRDYLETIMEPVTFNGMVVIRVLDVQVVVNALGRQAGSDYILELSKRMKQISHWVFHTERSKFILLMQLTDEHALQQTVTRLEELLGDTVVLDQTAGRPCVEMAYDYAESTASEVYSFREKVTQMINTCELAMEYKKISGISGAVAYNEAIGIAMSRYYGIQNEIATALDQNEFSLVYQPIIDLKNGQISAIEVLLRWNNHTYGAVTPAEFIPMLESSGAIHDVGFFVFKTAFSNYSVLVQDHEAVNLHINVSTIQLMNPNFLEQLHHLMLTEHFNPEHLVVEIGDANDIEALSTTKDQIVRLSQLGVKIAFDDFGSKNTSLDLLSKIKTDYIKIDRRFFENIHKSVTDAILLSGLIAMASKMDIEIIAESVESYEQMLFILNQKCRYIQGFYFEKPLSFEILLKQMHNSYSDQIYHKVQDVFIKDFEHYYADELSSELHGTELGIIETDANGTILNVNAEMQKWCHAAFEAFFLKNIEEWFMKPLQFKTFYEQGQFEERQDISAEIYTLEHNSLHMTVGLKIIRDEGEGFARYVWFFENVEVYHQHKRGILETRDSYKKVFNLSPLPIVIWNREYHVIDYNLQAAKLFVGESSKSNVNISQWIADSSIERFRKHLEELVLVGDVETELECLRIGAERNGMHCRWISQCQKNENGEVIRIVTIMVDITEQLHAEGMKKLFAQQERLAAVGHLAAGIAHEINNPLSYMMTNTNYLLKLKAQLADYLKEDALLKEDLFDIFDSYDEGLGHIKTIVSDLKSFVHMNVTDEREVVKLNLLIGKVLNIAHNEIKYTSKVRTAFDENLPDLFVNSAKIQQVMLNIILNANHAIVSRSESEEGFEGLIQITTYFDETFVCCDIADNGCGMSDEVIQKIFEPFFTTKPEGVGTGLGLPISKEIIEQYHGGQLSVSSIVGKGTTFSICLPLENIEMQGGTL